MLGLVGASNTHVHEYIVSCTTILTVGRRMCGADSPPFEACVGGGVWRL